MATSVKCKVYMHYTVQLNCTLYHKDQNSVSKKATWEEAPEKSEIVTCEDTTQVATNMQVWFIWSKPLGRMVHNMLKWLVIYILNKLALYLYEGELCFKVIERIYKMAINENSGLWFDRPVLWYIFMSIFSLNNFKA